MDGKYLPIQSFDIEANSIINFDLYVNLPLNNKYILYRKKGDCLESGQLKKLTAGFNVRNFFIQREDYQEFVKYVAGRLKNLVGCEDNEINRRLLQTSAKSILTSTFKAEDSATAEALLANLNDITATIIESILETTNLYKKKTFQRLAALAENGTHFQKHPVNVASFAVLIALGIGYSTEKILADLAMAALLHDVGLTRLSPQVIAKAHTPRLLNAREREMLYDHPQWAIEILAERKIELSKMAELIILQHHEEFNGFGYPKGLRGFNLNQFAQILKVADELDELVALGFSSTGNLLVQVQELTDRLQVERTIEPGLSQRIRNVLV
jgi:HD-GYP domain-containing protein (c-di-GMP phosphodiesterase class II)